MDNRDRVFFLPKEELIRAGKHANTLKGLVNYLEWSEKIDRVFDKLEYNLVHDGFYLRLKEGVAHGEA